MKFGISDAVTIATLLAGLLSAAVRIVGRPAVKPVRIDRERNGD